MKSTKIKNISSMYNETHAYLHESAQKFGWPFGPIHIAGKHTENSLNSHEFTPKMVKLMRIHANMNHNWWCVFIQICPIFRKFQFVSGYFYSFLFAWFLQIRIKNITGVLLQFPKKEAFLIVWKHVTLLMCYLDSGCISY